MKDRRVIDGAARSPEKEMALALEIARRACALRYDDLPPAAIGWAKVGLLDYLGVTLAGSREPAARLALQALGAPGAGASAVFGTGKRLNALDAAIVNG